MANRKLARSSILTRSMSHASFVALAKSNVSCFSEITEKSIKRPFELSVSRPFSPTDGGSIKKKTGRGCRKAAFRKDRNPMARMDSLQRLFKGMGVEDDPDDALCYFCKESEENCCCTKYPIAQIGAPSRRGSDSIIPMLKSPEGFSSVSGPYQCSLTNPTTGKGWHPRGVIVKAKDRPHSGLHYWTITGTNTNNRVHVFGYQDRRGAWKYATVKPNLKIRFESNSDPPDFIDADQVQVNHNHAFSLEDTSSGFIIQSSSRQGHYVRINMNHRHFHIEVSGDQRLADVWQLN